MSTDVINATPSSRFGGPLLLTFGIGIAAMGFYYALTQLNPDTAWAMKLLNEVGVTPQQVLYITGAVVTAFLVIFMFGRGSHAEDEGSEEGEGKTSAMSVLMEGLGNFSASAGNMLLVVAILLSCNMVAAALMGYDWLSHNWQYAMVVAASLEAVAIALFQRSFNLGRSNQDQRYFALMIGSTLIGAAVVSQVAAQLKYQVFGVQPVYLFFYVAGIGFTVWLVAHPMCRLKNRSLASAIKAFVLIFAPFWLSVVFMGKFGWSELTCLIPVAIFWSAIIAGRHFKKQR